MILTYNILNFYIRSCEWLSTLAILIFVINLKNVCCKNYYLKWFYLTLKTSLITIH